MPSTLRVLGFLCLIATVGAAVSLLPLSLLPAFAFAGVLFLALAAILDRLVTIEFLLKSARSGGTDRVKTELGDFEKLGKVEGQATCVGCRRAVPKAGLYYNESLDAYYHPECLARDRRSR